MGFRHLIFVVACLYGSVMGENICPFQPEYDNQNIHEANFFGIWYPQLFISNSEITIEDLERYSCMIYNAEKDAFNFYSLKLKRFNHKYKDDPKMHLYDVFQEKNRHRFGTFFHPELQFGDTIIPSVFSRIIDMPSDGQYMVILSCFEIEETRKLSIYGFVMGRETILCGDHAHMDIIYSNAFIDRTLKPFMMPINGTKSSTEHFSTVKLTQNFKVCVQHDVHEHIFSGAFRFMVQSSVILLYPLTIILLISVFFN